MDINSTLLKQLEELEIKFEELRAKSEKSDLSGGTITVDSILEFITGSRAAIARIAGNNSAYMTEFEAARATKLWIGSHAIRIAGIIRQLKQDLDDGYLSTTRELLHAETFADFLDMAAHLLSEGYKDAAAVIAGSSLEVHLRNLAAKHSLSVELNGKPKKADQLNSELASASAYSKLDQKNVTAWLDLRNKAAHGHYQDYSKTQVERLWIDRAQPRSYPKLNKPATLRPNAYCRTIGPLFSFALASALGEMAYRWGYRLVELLSSLP